MARLRSALFDMICPKEHAARAAVLAFRCAWHNGESRDTACAAALRAYLNLLPGDGQASDNVVKALVEAIRHRPHWVGAEG